MFDPLWIIDGFSYIIFSRWSKQKCGILKWFMLLACELTALIPCWSFLWAVINVIESFLLYSYSWTHLLAEIQDVITAEQFPTFVLFRSVMLVFAFFCLKLKKNISLQRKLPQVQDSVYLFIHEKKCYKLALESLNSLTLNGSLILLLLSKGEWARQGFFYFEIRRRILLLCIVLCKQFPSSHYSPWVCGEQRHRKKVPKRTGREETRNKLSSNKREN